MIDAANGQPFERLAYMAGSHREAKDRAYAGLRALGESMRSE